MSEQDSLTKDELCRRIEAYLVGGGLFNPELANHAAVRDLIIDMRDEIDIVNSRLDMARDQISTLNARLGDALDEIEDLEDELNDC